MPFMDLYVYPKGAVYSADCDRCGGSIYIHEWTTDDFNGDRDAMEAGTLACPDCSGHANPETFRREPRPMYAARYSANGYMDCTDWHYDTNKRRLSRDLREMYGDNYE